jgi:hypothetical protein
MSSGRETTFLHAATKHSTPDGVLSSVPAVAYKHDTSDGVEATRLFARDSIRLFALRLRGVFWTSLLDD